MTELTKENAKYGLIIISKDNPEWGTWVMQDRDSYGNDPSGWWSIRGNRGTTTLFEGEFRFWRLAEKGE